MQYQGIDEQRIVNIGLAPIARDLDLPLVCTNDVHYLHRTDHRPHDILLCIGTGKTVNDADRLRYHGDQFYLKTRGRRWRRSSAIFPKRWPTPCASPSAATSISSETVNHLPNFDVPAGFTLDDYFEHVVREGFDARLPRLKDLPGARRSSATPSTSTSGGSTYEVEMIKQMKYPGYFLIVWDFIRYAREHGHPGRTRPRLGRRQLRRLLPAHHRRRPASSTT